MELLRRITIQWLGVRKAPLTCSFCGKPRGPGRRLIAAGAHPGASICNHCVATSQRALETFPPPDDSSMDS
jgi:hypothetical protein